MNIKSRVDILADMIRWARNNNSSLTDFNPGSVIRSIYNAIAAQIAQLYYAAHKSYRSSRILYAMGSDLDSLVPERSITRNNAVKSSVTLVFSGGSGISIPSGTKAATEDGVTFETIETKSIGSDGGNTSNIAAEAVLAGKGGNVRAETITVLIDTIDGVTYVTNPARATGGQDYETDELLRNRAINRIAAMSLGISDSYKAWAQEADSSVLNAKPQWGHPSYSDKTIVIHLVKDNGGVYTESELTAIQNYTQYRAPLGTTAKCLNLTWTTIDITAQIRMKQGYSMPTVKNYIEDNVSIYLDYRNREFGDDVEWSDIYALINNTEGVEDVSTALFTPASNVTVDDFSLPKLGTIQVSQW